MALGSHAQTLQGTVADEHGERLAGVQVYLPALGRGTVADAEGRFRLTDLRADTATVVFSLLGFHRATRLVDLRQAPLRLEVVLQEKVARLEGVVVSEDAQRAQLVRAAQSVTVLTAAELDAVRGQTLGEMLETLPGVTTLSTGPTIDKPVIRGLHSERVVVLNRGIRQEGQQWGAEHAPEIDPFSPARIEVVRGAAGVAYGLGAIGGVVRLEPAPLPTTPSFGGRLTLNGFSNSQQGAGSVEVAGSPAAVPGLGVRVQASLRRAGAAQTPDYVLGNTGFHERTVAAHLGYQRGGWRFAAQASHFATDLGIYRGSHFNTFAALDAVIAAGRPPVDYAFSYEIGAPKQTIRHTLVALSGQYRLPKGTRLEVQYGGQRNARQEFDADRIGGRDPLARPAFDLILTTHTLDAKVQLQPFHLFGEDAFVVFGGSGMNQGNTSTIGYLIPNFRALTGGAFAYGTWIRGRLTVEVGARGDYRWMRAFPRAEGNRGDFERQVRQWGGGSGVVGAIWRFAPAWSLAGNVATAWRPPSVNELYSFGVHHGTAQFEIGTPGLRTERSLGLDLTLRHQSRRAALELSAFRNRLADYIYLRPDDETVVTIRGVFPQYTQAQTDAVLLGVDGFAAYTLFRTLTLRASASLVRGTDQRADQPLLAIPADRATLSASLQLPDLGPLVASEVEVGATFVRRQTRYPTRVDDTGHTVPLDYVAPPPGYRLLRLALNTDLAVGRQRLRVAFSIDNLLDTRYRDYLSRYRFFAHDTGRNIALRLMLPLGDG